MWSHPLDDAGFMLRLRPTALPGLLLIIMACQRKAEGLSDFAPLAPPTLTTNGPGPPTTPPQDNAKTVAPARKTSAKTMAPAAAPPTEQEIRSWLESLDTSMSELEGVCMNVWVEEGQEVAYIDKKWRQSSIGHYVRSQTGDTAFSCENQHTEWACSLGFLSQFAGGESAVILQVRMRVIDGSKRLTGCDFAG